MTLIYKIATGEEWRIAQASGSYEGAPVDLADGFIHFSTAPQVRETAAKHFAGKQGLVLLALEAESLGEKLKWEPSRGGALFPHLYRAFSTGEVVWAKPLPLCGGMHDFEGLLE
ncbi:MAG: DUF952 domain-containing protein [Alphaproteobacteria bacterium]|nr:DUF952 domain-containing protein [Alphaproteobacteria bacterium]